jgi:hypothetical protein
MVLALVRHVRWSTSGPRAPPYKAFRGALVASAPDRKGGMMAQAARPRNKGMAPRKEAPRGSIPSLIHAALDAVRRWWRIGRHYRPERRYMRGGRRDAAPAIMDR